MNYNEFLLDFDSWSEYCMIAHQALESRSRTSATSARAQQDWLIISGIAAKDIIHCCSTNSVIEKSK
jgi:hypothetical protein